MTVSESFKQVSEGSSQSLSEAQAWPMFAPVPPPPPLDAVLEEALDDVPPPPPLEDDELGPAEDATVELEAAVGPWLSLLQPAQTRSATAPVKIQGESLLGG